MPDETPSIGSEPAPATVPPAGELPGPRPPSDPATPAPPAAESSVPAAAESTPAPAPSPAPEPAAPPAAESSVPAAPEPAAPPAAAPEAAIAAPPTAQSLPPAPVTTTAPPAPPPATPAPPTSAPATPAPPQERPPAESTPVEAAPTPPASSKRLRRLVGTLVFGVIVLVLLGAIGYVLYQRLYADPTREAMAGDCLADLPIVAVGEDQEVRSARLVSCDDPAATFVVEGRLDSVSETQAGTTEICQAYEEARFIYRAVPRGGTGYVLCLRQLGE